VDESLGMHEIKGSADRSQPLPQGDRLHGERAALPHSLPPLEAAAGQIRHDGVGHALLLAHVMNWHDRLMRQMLEDCELPRKTLDEARRGDAFGTWHLHHAVTIGHCIPGAVCDAHAARADHCDDPIAAGERVAKLGFRVICRCHAVHSQP